ncbi:LacI family DNA-binding transcriptional regulator [Microbacterium radiodurans]|uniref:LacI family DNA-binding transcriptional regulator n=1 Tax=Microbacterium radiodurans TaxID=661398 RepID=UPI00168B43DB|nr:LacI family DNA-binding transcriptional regulator [Microbacterium radiodurans]
MTEENDLDDVAARSADVPREIRERVARRGAATIYDVAALAGVNPSTVSRALTKPGRIGRSTESRIHAAARQLDFHVNPMARALPTGRSHTIGVIVADITNPVIFGIVRGAEQAAALAGYTLIIAESQESETAELETIRRLLASVDGLVLATTRLSDDAISEIAERRAVVVLNRAVAGVASVLPDVRKGVAELMEHVMHLGHTSVAYLGGPTASWISQRRWAEIAEHAARSGIDVVNIGPNSPTIAGGDAAWERARVHMPTVVVAFNDLLAIGLMQAAARSGTDIPGSVAVAGFDDIFGSDLIVPALTTVRSELPTAGERAVRHLLAGLGVEGARSEVDRLFDTSLIIRQSTGPRAG